MAIRCSIVGCEYEDTFIEREEDRRGEEVILTVREFKECKHCGNTELISENTGVTAVVDEEADRTDEGVEGTADPAGATGTDLDEDDGATRSEGDGTDLSGDDGAADRAVETDSTPAEAADPSTDPGIQDDARTPEVEAGGPDAASPSEPDESAVEDDAVVLGDSTSDAPRGPDEGTEPPADSDDAVEGVVADAASAAGDPDSGTDRSDVGAPTTADEADDSDDAVLIDSTATETDRTGGLDTTATVEDGPTITGAIREAEEEYPEDDAVILESSGGDGAGQFDYDGDATGEWPDHDDALLEAAGSTAASPSGSTADDPAGSPGDGGTESTQRRSTAAAAGGGSDRATVDEWPDQGDPVGGEGDPSGPAEGEAWPDAGGADQGFDATPQDDADPDVAFSGLTPTASEESAEADAVTVGTGTVSTDRPLTGRAEPTDGIEGASGDAEPTSHSAGGDPSGSAGSGTDGEHSSPRDPAGAAGGTARSSGLYCDGCDNEIDRSGSPHRAGDICPECVRGYLQRR